MTFCTQLRYWSFGHWPRRSIAWKLAICGHLNYIIVHNASTNYTKRDSCNKHLTSSRSAHLSSKWFMILITETLIPWDTYVIKQKKAINKQNENMEHASSLLDVHVIYSNPTEYVHVSHLFRFKWKIKILTPCLIFRLFFHFFFNIHKLTFPKRFTFDESSDEKKNLTWK